MSHFETAKKFFDACGTGKGWDICFDCKANALADTRTLATYCDCMKALLTPMPDARYELTSFALDAERGTVVATAAFHGTQTGKGGPVAPTGKKVVSDYAYVVTFEGAKIAHMTKIWNDVQALRGLGWS